MKKPSLSLLFLRTLRAAETSARSLAVSKKTVVQDDLLFLVFTEAFGHTQGAHINVMESLYVK